jgi:hypothetical protein
VEPKSGADGMGGVNDGAVQFELRESVVDSASDGGGGGVAWTTGNGGGAETASKGGAGAPASTT